MPLSEEELKETSQGARPYSSQQNEASEEKKEQPKVVVQKPNDNGEKLFKKCPTCGSFVEVNSTMTQSQPIQSQFINGRVVNQLLKPMPQDNFPHNPQPRVTDESVDAHWTEGGERIPQTPIR